MNDTQLSVVIPTYNRRDILRKCLGALFNQTYAGLYEIIIVDDGSTDGTEEMIKEFRASAPAMLKYYRQGKKSPASARNLGIRNAKGRIILFMGDDIIATSALVEKHIRRHTIHPEDTFCLLGYVTWSPEIKITPFMYWLENGGPQFALNNLPETCEVDWRYFITPNISLKKKFVVDNNLYFDERFPYAMLEDTEFGYRLHQKGARIFFDRSAIGYHYHYTSLHDSCKRMIVKGKSARILEKVNPLLAKKVVFVKKHGLIVNSVTISFFWLLLARLAEKRWHCPRIYRVVMGYYYLKGYYT